MAEVFDLTSWKGPKNYEHTTNLKGSIAEKIQKYHRSQFFHIHQAENLTPDDYVLIDFEICEIHKLRRWFASRNKKFIKNEQKLEEAMQIRLFDFVV